METKTNAKRRPSHSCPPRYVASRVRKNLLAKLAHRKGEA